LSKKDYKEIMHFSHYHTDGFYDELFLTDGQPRAEASPLIAQINALSTKDLRRRQRAAELAMFQQGITFSVYGDRQGHEKIIPFDILPRIITAQAWEVLERGLKQRITALNAFIHDVYHHQNILRDGVIPRELVLSSACYLPACQGLTPPKNIWAHIAGIDLVRDESGTFYVLEDNVRCPSGISYVLENRTMQKRTFPRAFEAMRVRPVSNYPNQLYQMLRQLSEAEDPTVVVLTPGMYNSAYFEHAFLAQQMGVFLAEGSDLTVADDYVWLKTTRGLKKVDVIYRRIDDIFLDPLAFRPDSLLGVPGIMDCYWKGNVALANAPGTGVADDKAIYAYVPAMIRYYLGEEAIIPNVPTYLCSDDQHRQYVLDNLEKLVVKAVNLSGGYGMLIGPKSTAEERATFANAIAANPRDYIGQPTLSLSRAPTLTPEGIEGRHVDFRPYILSGDDVFVLPGGLTRVALVKGSLVVNSSQGGGSKDTWILGD
jgi:uncharacterized circularly permuted ATP-grasp superfamily protein